MNDAIEKPEDMNANDIFAAVHNLKKKLEENFVTLGQLFSTIKRRKMYTLKGFDNFKDFVEAEYNINSTLAGKLSSVYELYIGELDLDDTSVKELGFDRLSMIKPFVAKADWDVRDEWIQKAETMPVNELKDHIKELKKKEKDSEKDVKDVLISQYIERMRVEFNCSVKELNFKLALYFQDVNLDEIKKIIIQKQRQFEEELQSVKETKE